MNHLNDDIIQTYLDGGTDSLSSDEQGHLNNCAECARKLEQYRFLSSVAADEPIVELSPDFARKVAVAAMGSSTAEAAGSRIYSLYLPIAATIAAMVTWALIVGKDIFVSTVVSGFVVGYEAVRSPFESLLETESVFGENIGLMIAAGLLLLLFGSMDRIIRAARRTRRLMMSI